MAYKSNAVLAEIPPMAPAGRRLPVDLNHLHSQTFGDRKLQRDVLKIFLRHSVEQLQKVKAAGSVEDRREAAHNLSGSARGIGAFSVAYIASEIELAKGPVIGRIRALEAATETVRYFIEDLLSE